MARSYMAYMHCDGIRVRPVQGDDESGSEEEDEGVLRDPLGIVEYDKRDGRPILEEVGEPVDEAEALFVQTIVFNKISRGRLGQQNAQTRFLGSQPISLERAHLGE